MKTGAVLVGALLLAGCATQPAPVAPPPPPAASVPAAMQYLYGSGEAAAISEQAYNMLVDAVRRRLASEQADPRRDTDRTSAVLTRDATIEQPTTVPCGALPRAAVFDVDETMLLNLGFEYNDAVHPGRRYDPARWADWEQTGVDRVVAVPGAVQAVTALRRMGVTVVFNTNRSAANAAFTEAALDRAGLGPARHGETLFLKGDVAGEANKDGRRALIASRYCVVAMGGDQLGDFSDLFDGGPPAVRRAAAQAPAIRGLWGRFWFMLPNPVYGSALTGGLDDLFPSDKRWPMPAQEK